MRKISFIIIIMILAQAGTSQVFRRNGDNIEIEHSKGVIKLYSSVSGDLYINDVFLTSITETDTLYIANLEPGNFDVQVKGTGFTGPKHTVSVKNRKVTELRISADNIEVDNVTDSYTRVTEFIAGKPVVFVRSNAVYLNINRDLFFRPNAFSLMGTYQIVPGFCPGVGIMDYKPYDHDVRLMPVYLHLVSYFASGKVAPYVKLDLGTVIVLNHPKDEYYNIKRKIIPGSYFAPGLGFRFTIVKNLSGIAEMDFRKLTYKLEETSETTSWQYNYSDVSLFEISVGLGYQF